MTNPPRDDAPELLQQIVDLIGTNYNGEPLAKKIIAAVRADTPIRAGMEVVAKTVCQHCQRVTLIPKDVLAALLPTEAPSPSRQNAETWEVTYRNWRGEVSVRRIIPHHVYFGSTDWHPEPQWLLTAFDVDKQASRDFALKDFGPPPAAPTDTALVKALRKVYSALRFDGEHAVFKSGVRIGELKRTIEAALASRAAPPEAQVTVAESNPDLNLAAWMDRRRTQIGPWANYLIREVGNLEQEVAALRALEGKA